MNHSLHLSTIKEMNLRIMPFIMVLYLIAYIDRANISVAALQMNADLAMTAEMYGIAAGIFYVTYIIFEVPSNVLLTRVGARRWIARIMVSWGIIAAGMSLVQTPTQLYVMRFLLGAAEAGFTPGIIFYLSCWYPRSDRARAMSLFYIGAALASVIGLPLSGSLLNLHGMLGVEGWRWLFLLEGIPAFALGIVTWFYLDDAPANARWLTAEQRSYLQQTLA
ncbi:MAG TPA: MFS transporter, partial [Pantoea septica]|nr:MFS transporter [Pantoea septica]